MITEKKLEHLKVLIETVEDLESATGRDIECNNRVLIDQNKINAFAEACGDMQWIHVDASRAKRESPFGSTIGHGILLVAMCPSMLREAFELTGVERGVMYGLEKVRFPAPVLVGSTVSAIVRVLEVARIADGARATIRYQFTSKYVERPHCVAIIIHQFTFARKSGGEIVGNTSRAVQ